MPVPPPSLYEAPLFEENWLLDDWPDQQEMLERLKAKKDGQWFLDRLPPAAEEGVARRLRELSCCRFGGHAPKLTTSVFRTPSG
jgi:hypothetical protein